MAIFPVTPNKVFERFPFISRVAAATRLRTRREPWILLVWLLYVITRGAINRSGYLPMTLAPGLTRIKSDASLKLARSASWRRPVFQDHIVDRPQWVGSTR
jgi:hypothetical protein